MGIATYESVILSHHIYHKCSGKTAKKETPAPESASAAPLQDAGGFPAAAAMSAMIPTLQQSKVEDAGSGDEEDDWE